MGKRGSRHSAVATLSGGIPSGVDFSSSPTSIPAGYALDMLNMIYPDQQLSPATRPGIELVTWDETDSDDPVDALYVWEKNATTSYTIVAKGGKLYYLDGADLEEIGSITASVTPCFCNFNQKLIIADKSAGGLKSWDGTTLSTIAGSPASPTVCMSHAARLWCNSMADGELDTVYASAVEDETGWTIYDGGESITTEYGSGLWVSALASFNSELIVFKSGVSGARQIYRINTSGTPDTWSGVLFSSGSTCLNHSTVATIGTMDVMFADADGVKMLAGTDTYGDFSIASTVGQRVMPRVTTAVKSLTPISPWGGVLLIATGLPACYLFHPHNVAWCPLSFTGKTITAACSSTTDVFLGDSQGRVWKATGTATDEYITDELTVSTAAYESYVHTPLQTDSYGMILRRLDVLMDVLTAGEGTVKVVGADLVTETQIGSWDSEKMDTRILGDDVLIFGDEELIFSTSEAHFLSLSRFRTKSLSVKVAAASGRFKVNQISYEVARVAA